MDFSTVYHRLENNLYTDPDVFVRDVRLIFSNSRTYNTIPRSRVIMSYLNLLQITIRAWDAACILRPVLFPLPLVFLSSFGFHFQIYSMTIRLSAMFEDRIDNVLSDWYESESGGARRTRLRTIRLLESHAPGSSGVPRQRMARSGSQTNTASSSDVGSNSDSLNTRETRTRSVATRAAITTQSEQTNGHRHHSERPETRGNVRAISQSRNQQNNDNSFEETEVLTSGRPTRSTRSSARRELVMRFPASRIRQSSQEETVANGPSTSRYSTRRSASLAQRNASVNDEESEEEEEEEGEEEEEIGEEEQGGSEEEDEEQGGDSEGDEDEEEDDEEEEEDEEEESDDSTEDSRHQTRRKTARPTHRPTVALRTKRASTTNARSSRANSSTSSARRTSETSQPNAIAPARRSLRRNSAARRVRYNENDSDSESDSVNNEIIGVSSRGRVRKPAIRMQDYVE